MKPSEAKETRQYIFKGFVLALLGTAILCYAIVTFGGAK